MDRNPSKFWTGFFLALGLSITTIFSSLLLAASERDWTLNSDSYNWVVNNRATVQLLLQLLSNALALIYVTIISGLINRASRIYWKDRTVRPYIVQFWHSLCTRSVNWHIPFHLLIPLLLYILVTAIPSAIWAGALTPIATTITIGATLDLPSYQNTTSIKEWPSEINSQGPSLRNSKGRFSYSVGMQFQGSLLLSASSATPTNDSTRQHEKLDNSRFTYFGRSFGVGSSVGLLDDALLANELLQGYSYEETGYDTAVTCIHNASSQFKLKNAGNNWFEAYGNLPNSGDVGPEDSSYIGHGSDAIVAIGVGRNPEDPRRMLAIAAGKSYGHLNATQCSMSFQPALFQVNVGVVGRNITVDRIKMIDGFQDGGNLTQVVMRQFELISNDQTSLYTSVVGNSLNDSISDVISAYNGTESLSLEEATLPGAENGLQAMVDDMLVAYASAQIMIQQDTMSTNCTTTLKTMRIGDVKYIYAIFAVNIAVFLFVVLECIRTQFWKGVHSLDYLDPVSLMATKLTADSETEPSESLLWGRYDGAVPLQTLQAGGWPVAAGRRLS